jgi:DNA-binding beta-propeller fold protein YncE
LRSDQEEVLAPRRTTVTSSVVTGITPIETVDQPTLVTVSGSDSPKVNSVNVGDEPEGMVVDPTNGELYGALGSSSSVAVINGTTDAGPVEVAVDTDTSTNYV